MKALLLFSFLSLPLFAQPLEVELKDFNFSYSDPYGSGSATSFYRNMKRSSGVEIEVEKVLESLRVKVAGSENHEFSIQNAPSIAQEAHSMSIEEMNLSFRNRLEFAIYSGEFISAKNHALLEDFKLSCGRDRNLVELLDQVASGCVKELSLNASHFNSEDAKALIQRVLGEKLGSDMRIRNLDLKSQLGSYKLSAEVKAQISGTARSKGNLSYHPKSGILTIKISEFKFGILNVKGMVFKELKKQQGDNLRVDEPYVHLTVK